MRRLKEPCLKFFLKTGLLIYTLLYSFSILLFSNWHIGVGHVMVPVLFFFQFYFLLFFLQRRGVRCGEVRYDGGSFSVPAFALGGLLMASVIFSLDGDGLGILAYIVVSTVVLIVAMWLAKGSEPAPTAEPIT
jgi:hypothetical protein